MPSDVQTLPKLEIYQPGLKDLEKVLLRSSLSQSQVSNLLDHLDTKNILLGVMSVSKNAQANPGEFKVLLQTAMRLAQMQTGYKSDTVPEAINKIEQLPEKDTQELQEKFNSEYEPFVDDPTNFQTPNGQNEFFEYMSEKVQGVGEDKLKELWKRHLDSPTGKNTQNFLESKPAIAAEGTETTSIGVATSVATGGFTMTAVAATAPVAAGANFVGFSMSSQLAAEIAYGAGIKEAVSFGLFNEISGAAVSQNLGVAAHSGMKYFMVTEKGFRFSSRIVPITDYIARTPGVTAIASGARAATIASSTAVSSGALLGSGAATATGAAASGAAAGAAAGTAAGAATSAVFTPIVGAIVGAVVSQLPKIWKFIKENIAPVLGGLVFSSIFVATGSLMFAGVAGLLTTGGTMITSSAISGFGAGTGMGSPFVGSAASRTNLIFLTIAGRIATDSIMPIIVGVLITPILLALFLIIINSGAYVVPIAPDTSFVCDIGGGDPIVAPGATLQLLPDYLTPRMFKRCIVPTTIVVHWSGGWNGVQGTFNTLVARDLSCQFATDENTTLQMLLMWKNGVEYSWCAGGTYNDTSVNIEMSGLCFSEMPGVCSGINTPPPASELEKTISLILWLKQQYNISTVVGHYQISNIKDDPGRGFMQNVICPRVGC